MVTGPRLHAEIAVTVRNNPGHLLTPFGVLFP